MRALLLILAIAAAVAYFGVPTWEKKEQPAGGKIFEKVDDALNRRDNEELRDAVEDAQKAAKDVVTEVKAAAVKKVEEFKGRE